MTDKPTRADFRDTRRHFDLPDEHLAEKDWYVVQAMQAIAAVDVAPFELVFAGGTCLARAHRLVRRMSEDVDFKLVPRVGAVAPANTHQLRRALGDMRDRISANLRATGFQFDPSDSKRQRSRDGNRYTVFNLAYGDTDTAGFELRPTLQIEMNYTALRDAPVSRAVTSFINEAFGRPAEIPSLPCVSVSETAAEKLVAVTRRIAMELAGVARVVDKNLVRHIYDLHAIREHIDRDLVIALARTIAQRDAEEFRHQYPAYAADIASETRKAVASWTTGSTTRTRYDTFVAAMVYGDPVPFANAAPTVAELVDGAWPSG